MPSRSCNVDFVYIQSDKEQRFYFKDVKEKESEFHGTKSIVTAMEKKRKTQAAVSEIVHEIPNPTTLTLPGRRETRVLMYQKVQQHPQQLQK
ncbi:hypothetical protein STEG23_023445, partial [Scotinomys teguina]